VVRRRHRDSNRRGQAVPRLRAGKETVGGVILHTDQGSEYAARSFRTEGDRIGVKQSMGRPGSALDNAVIDAWHSTPEFGLRRVEGYAAKAEARIGVAAFIDEYNRDGTPRSG
jgi:putative transposase